ncbi:MAG: hypothetical protein EB084_14350 [Proteobacteria bacterium]|nr:hypothetical protein [Pseudomonadota bacterium]
MMSRWESLKYWFLSSQAGAYLMPREVTLDMLTEQMYECRRLLAIHESTQNVEPVQLENWRTRLEQAEWEQVRRLERNGRADDPFVLWKKGIGKKPR